MCEAPFVECIYSRGRRLRKGFETPEERMKRLMIAALIVTALPAFADHEYDDRHSYGHDDDRDRDRDHRGGDQIDRPVVLDQDDLREQLDDLSKILDDIASESSSKKRARLVS